MIEQSDTDIFNYWRMPGCIICIPTNGATRDGAAIMGAGVALQMKQKCPGIDRELAKLLQRYGNSVHSLDDGWVRSFPTKHFPQDKTSDLGLIAESLWAVKSEASGSPDEIFILPRIGTGCGKLKWEQVKVMFKTCPDNMIVVTLED